jgi:hypothetical protein
MRGRFRATRRPASQPSGVGHFEEEAVMQSKAFWALNAALLCGVLAAPLAAAPQPVGDEFRVNTDGQSLQHNPVAAFNAAGNALVVWENDFDGLRGRFLSPAGDPLGAELGLVANDNLPSIPGEGDVTDRINPAVAFLPGGGFLLVWTEERAHDDVTFLFENRVVLSREIFMQRFGADGTPASQPQRVNQATSAWDSRPKLGVLGSGQVLVVWEGDGRDAALQPGDGVFGRLVSGAGALLGSEFRINATPQRAHNVALATDAMSGRTLVVWDGRAGAGPQIYGRLLDPAARPLGSDLRISNVNPGANRRPGVAGDGAGRFLVAWQGATDGVYDARVFGQVVGRGGNLLGAEQQISKGYGDAQIAPSVAPAPHGYFLVAWIEFQKWFPLGLAGVEVSGAAMPVGGEIWINQRQIGYKLQTAIGGNGAGGYLVPYECYYSGDNLGISARQLTVH